MTRKLLDTKTDRRAFLRDLATASGLAAVAGSTGAAVAAPAPDARPQATQPTGYRVTAHVSKYYDKARI